MNMGKLMSVVILFLVLVVSGGSGKRLRLTHVHFESDDDEEAIMSSYEDPKIAGYPARGETPLLMVSFQVGSTQTPQYAVMDSGSFRIWVACESNYKTDAVQSTAVFDPAASTSYRTLECQDPTCPQERDSCVTPSSPCWFASKYASDVAYGTLGFDSFTFSTYEGQFIHPQVLFGCTDPSYKWWLLGKNDTRFNGVFGLGDVKFLSNIGNGNPRMSYCIGNLSNLEDTTSHLQLGEDVELEGTTVTGLQNSDGKYKVDLETIAVGDNICADQTHTLAIDTGTLFLWIAGKWYPAVKAALNDVMIKLGYSEWVEQPRMKEHCYWGSVDKIEGFPGLTLSFGDGATLVLGAQQLFYHQRGRKSYQTKYFCTSIRKSVYQIEGKNVTILGVWAQQGLNMGFDVNAKRF